MGAPRREAIAIPTYSVHFITLLHKHSCHSLLSSSHLSLFFMMFPRVSSLSSLSRFNVRSLHTLSQHCLTAPSSSSSSSWRHLMRAAGTVTAATIGAVMVHENTRALHNQASTQSAAAAHSTPATSTSTASSSSNKSGDNPFATAPSSPSTLRVSLVQLNVTSDKVANLHHARDLVLSAVSSSHADVVVLPEMFNCPYSNDSFGPYSEVLPSGNSCASSNISKDTSPSVYYLSQLAREAGVYLVGGSMPEREANGSAKPSLYNTCLVFDPQGNIIAKHRKVHLFDIDVPGKMTFKESDTLSAGSQFTSFTIDTHQIKARSQHTSHATYTSGLGICYDIRFPLYAQTLRAQGVDMFIYPGAFNTTTGPLHWELLARARAVDNQSAVIVCSPARSTTASYQAWGHSSIVSPWGKVLATTEHQESIVTADINMNEIYEMRRNIPVSKQQRTDMYQLNNVQK